MPSRAFDHVYIVLTIFFTVYSQLIMRWQVGLAGEMSADSLGKLLFIGRLLLKPWVITALAASFLSGIAWMMAMTKFELSYAFPFVGLNFVLVLAASFLFLNETISIAKLVGATFIVIGVVVIARYS